MMPEEKLNDRKAHRRKVRFQCDDAEYLPSDEVAKKRRKKPARKSRKDVDYPDCTKEALLKAFEKANLPDYEAISQMPLNVVSVKPGEVDVRPKKPSPSLAQLLAPFTDLVVWSKVDLESSDPLRNYNRKQQNQVANEQTGGDRNNSWLTTSSVSRPSPSPMQEDGSISCFGSSDSHSERMHIASTPADGHPSHQDLGISAIHDQSPVTSKENNARSLFKLPQRKSALKSKAVIKQKVSEPLKQLQVNVHHPLEESISSRASFLKTGVESSQSVSNHSSKPIPKSRNSKPPEKRNKVSSNGKEASKVLASTPVGRVRVPLTSQLVSRIEVTPALDTPVASSPSALPSADRLGIDPNDDLVTRRPSRRKMSFDLCINLTKLQQPAVPAPHSQLRDSTNSSVSSCDSQMSYIFNPRGFRRSIIPVMDYAASAVQQKQFSRGRGSTFSKLSLVRKHLSTEAELGNAINSSFATALSESVLVYADGRDEILSAKNKVLLLCDPRAVTTFKAVLPEDVLTNCRKIGEGSYGEVFECVKSNKTRFILKIVALTPSEENEDVFAQILPELVISFAFTQLKEGVQNRAFNFIDITRAACVMGRFPKQLIEEWRKYDASRGSENENPAIYGCNQLFMITFLDNGGTDLEAYQFRSAVEALSVFRQLTMCLAVAEREYQFEHRDLHWGNVLLMPTDRRVLNYVLDSKKYAVDTSGVFCSVIDFSLSRICKDGIIVYDDLEKYEDLFSGKGDYQFDVYRLMRKENKRDWQKFSPKSNVFWLHYILRKLVESKKYRSRAKAHAEALKKLQTLAKTILRFASAEKFLRGSDLFDT